jgi:colicin import membrane protein
MKRVTFKTLLLMGGVSLGILGGLAFEAEALTFKERRIVNAMLTGLIPPDAVSDQVIREYLDMLRRDTPLSQQIQKLEEILRQRQAAEAEAPAAAEVGGGGGSRALSEEEQLERAKDESLKEAAEAAREEEQLEMVKAESLVEADEAKAIAEAVSEAEAKVAAAEAKSAAPRDPKAKEKNKKSDG